MTDKPILDVISGFLGSGKTTLIKRLLPVWQREGGVVIVENEFGDVSVDAQILQEGGSRVVELSSGCICCTLLYDFERELRRIVNRYKPIRVVIEPSGVGQLSDICSLLHNLEEQNEFRPGLVASCVDVLRFETYLGNFADFYADQIRSANALFLSRTESAEPAQLNRVCDSLRQLNPTAAIITTPWEQVAAEDLLAFALGGSAAVEPHEHDHEHHHHDHDHHDHEHEPSNAGLVAHAIDVPAAVSIEQLNLLLDRLDVTPSAYRLKGILPTNEGWMLVQWVPGERSITPREAAPTGQLTLIGTDINPADWRLM